MSVRRALAWSVSGQIGSTLALFVGTLVVVRLITPAEMGVFAVGFAAAGLINVLAAVGTNAYIIREAELDAARLDTAFTINAGLYAVLAAFMFLASYPAGLFVSEPGAGTVLRVLAVRPLLLIFEFRPSAMLQREMQFRPIAIILMLSSLVNVTTTVALAIGGYSYLSLAVGFVAASVVSAGCYNIVGRKHVRLRLSLSHWRPLTAFGLRMLTISGIAASVQRACELIMGRLLGLAALGIFTRATQIWDLLYFNVYGAATRVLFSKLSKDYRETGAIDRTYIRGLEMITAVAWPAAIGIAVLARPIIYILYGEQWLAAATPLSLLMIALFVAIGFGMNWELFVLKNETARQTRLELVRASFSLAAFTIGCLFSPAAAAAGRIADCVVGFGLYHRHINRLAGIESRDTLRVLGASLLLTCAAILPSVLVMAATGWSAQTPPLLLAGAVGSGIILWLALVAILRHPLLGELRQLALALHFPGASYWRDRAC